MSFGPASPDAGVELLRQLFLQCFFRFSRFSQPRSVLMVSFASQGFRNLGLYWKMLNGIGQTCTCTAGFGGKILKWLTIHSRSSYHHGQPLCSRLLFFMQIVWFVADWDRGGGGGGVTGAHFVDCDHLIRLLWLLCLLWKGKVVSFLDLHIDLNVLFIK